MVKHQGEKAIVKYKTLKRTNPQNREETLYYPAPVFGEQIGEDELTAEISFASFVNQSDVRSVFSNLLEILPRHLMHGDSVNLEKFGIFRLSFEAKGSREEKRGFSSEHHPPQDSVPTVRQTEGKNLADEFCPPVANNKNCMAHSLEPRPFHYLPIITNWQKSVKGFFVALRSWIYPLDNFIYPYHKSIYSKDNHGLQ